MKIIKGLIVSFLFFCSTVFAQQKSNVLLIAVDDLNDWIGVMGGHPQAQTPNMDRLAKRGVLFTNTQCQSPVCNPSRGSMMTSLYPSTTGIYFLNPSVGTSPKAKGHLVMPKRFEAEGYHVSAAGKLFHNQENKKYFKEYGGSFGGFGPLPKKKICSFPGMKLWDWGAYPERDEQMPDAKIAAWGKERLAREYDQPFFMGIGFYRPHVPQFAPQKWFDMYPLESVQMPKMRKDDIAGIPQYGVDLTREKHVAPTYEWVIKNKEEKKLVQSYLACVSFADAQVGKILDALDASPHKDNTYVVLYSDHGFHLGEKERYAKRSLWEDGARVPMMISGPGIKPGVSHKPTQLLDIYPTLLELTGLKPDSKLEGNSLLPLLRNPQSEWPHYARTSFGPGNYAIVSERYRFIQYNDGSEEFYDRSKDPNEWSNQAKNPEYASIIAKHRQQVPQERAPILGKNSTGHKAFAASEVKR